MPASVYTQQNVLNAALRGTVYPLPAGTYISLHTADPGETGASEVSTGTWPGYVRRHVENGAAIGTGWSAADANGQSKNAKQITFPTNNGAGNITISHFAIWDDLAAGNLIATGVLNTPVTLAIGEIQVFDINALTVTQT